MQSSGADRPPSAGSVIDGARTVTQTTTRIFYGGYLILAMAAVVVSWKVAPGALVQVSILLVVLTVVASLLTTALSRQKSVAARVLLWAILGALVISLGAFVSASLFGWPEPARILVARLLRQEMLASGFGENGTLVIKADDTVLQSQAFEPPHTAGDRFDRVAELGTRPAVTLVGSSIRVREPVLYFGILRLENASLTFDGPGLTIEAVRIEAVGNSSIHSASATATAGNGPGTPGGNLKLIIYDRILGQLSIDLRGGPGGRGAPGQPGINGANGGPGENSAQSLFDCRHGGGPGGPGLSGGKGGDGGPGYPGGSGGVLTIVAPDPAQASRAIAFSEEGGSGGKGGDPGRGGLGGHGGPGGHGGGYCGGGQAGPNGPDGPPGQQGPDGGRGTEGKRNVRDLAADSAR
jgi:hypothetical protein